jgi:hypothetical protein
MINIIDRLGGVCEKLLRAVWEASVRRELSSESKASKFRELFAC